MLQTSFEETLNLTAYACQEARVQLGAINKFGEAETNYAFHTSLTIDVYGGTEIDRERERERERESHLHTHTLSASRISSNPYLTP